MFSLGEGGKKVDAHLHEPILSDVAANDAINRQYIRRLIDGGYHKDFVMRVAREIAAEQLSRVRSKNET